MGDKSNGLLMVKILWWAVRLAPRSFNHLSIVFRYDITEDSSSVRDLPFEALGSPPAHAGFHSWPTTNRERMIHGAEPLPRPDKPEGRGWL